MLFREFKRFILIFGSIQVISSTRQVRGFTPSQTSKSLYVKAESCSSCHSLLHVVEASKTEGVQREATLAVRAREGEIELARVDPRALGLEDAAPL